MNNKQSEEVWIALVRVLPRPGDNYLGEGMKIGWTNALSFAVNEHDFISRINFALDELGLDLSEIEDPEPLHLRLSKWEIEPELTDLVKEVEQTGEVRFSTFHVSAKTD